MAILVTGAAGFIGMHLAERLLAVGEAVVGVDNFNDYYSPALKVARSARLEGNSRFRMVRMDIADASRLQSLVQELGADRVVHLAAQAGVRYSIDQPFAYEHSNLKGHLSVLEACRRAGGVRHLVYASSSSVYGDRPAGSRGFSEEDPVDHPVSLYAATKRAGELMSATYSHLYRLPLTGLRFFTAYGPWGRPDMAYYSFTERLLAGAPIEVFGEGRMARDFTYIDDIVEGIVRVLELPPANGGHRILNLGGSRPHGLLEMIRLLEAAVGIEARKVMLPMQPGDVTSTYADISKLQALTGYEPQTTLAEGLRRFVEWRRAYGAG